MTTWNDYDYHRIPGGGDGDGDDAAAMAQWEDNAQEVWSPASWHKSPMQLQQEAHASFVAAFESSAAGARKRNDPPCPAGRDRPF